MTFDPRFRNEPPPGHPLRRIPSTRLVEIKFKKPTVTKNPIKCAVCGVIVADGKHRKRKIVCWDCYQKKGEPVMMRTEELESAIENKKMPKLFDNDIDLPTRHKPDKLE